MRTFPDPSSQGTFFSEPTDEFRRAQAYDLPADAIFPAYSVEGPNQSPNVSSFYTHTAHTHAHVSTHASSALGSTAMPPMSARWDRPAHLPPSSEIPLEGLGFEESFHGLDGMGFEGEMMDDFGAALAQAEEMGGW
jgi:HMG box factor